ncbi:MAG: tetratricopeptide repeat protein, partial [Planctomycetota bacterium]
MFRANETEDDETRQQRLTESRRLVEEALDSDGDKQKTLWAAISIIANDPEGGPERSLGMLNQAIASEDLPDNAATRERRAMLIAAVGGENAAVSLEALTEGIDEWSDFQKSLLMSAIGMQLNQIGERERAWELVQRAAELAPNDLPTQRRLFDLAVGTRDMQKMDEAQQRILEIIDEDDPDYVLTEAKRRLIGAALNKVPRQDLEAIKKDVQAAMSERPDWHELQFVSAQLEMVLGGDSDAALNRLRAALEKGPSNTRALAMQVQLLASQGRYEEAHRQLKLIPESLQTDLLDRLPAEIYQSAGQQDAAYRAAERAAQRKPNDPATQLWFAQIARSAGRLDVAESTLLELAEITPSSLQLWEQLVAIYAQQRDADKLTLTLRRAQLGVDEDMLPSLMAKSYELFGRWQQAEKLLLSIYENRLDEPFANRQLAQFYLNWAANGDADPLVAAPYINHLLKGADAGDIAQDNPHVNWARRQAANLMFKEGTYDSSLKA